MVSRFLKLARTKPRGRVVDVGWVLDADSAGFIWEAPRKVSRPAGQSTHAKGVDSCPAVNDHLSRLLEIPCPIDLNIGFRLEGEAVRLVDLSGDSSTIRPQHLGRMCKLANRSEWRHPARPILQIATPYVFLADEPVWMTQLPPFNHFARPGLPGSVIGGRFPIDIWPRPLAWAFEWFDTAQPLVMRRGEPWFYLAFETMDPSRRIRPTEAALTPALREYLDGLKGVTNYVGRTFSLFGTAQARRPDKLLTPKTR